MMLRVLRAVVSVAVGLVLICSLQTPSRSQTAGANDERMVRESAEYSNARGGPAPHIRTSAHFALHWGDDNKTNVKIDEAYLGKAMDWLEHLWSLYIDTYHFPAGKHRYKINAYITSTGLKPFLDGYAYGFADPDGYGVLIGHPSIFTYGHNGAAHELVHALQGETKGFRDSDYVGWFWECHAQFLAHQATGKSDLPHVLDRYAQSCQWDIASTRHHYGSWIFFQYIAEHIPNGMAIVNHLWIEPALNKDEDPIAKLHRTLPFKGDRDTAWADLIGDYAKRNVTWSSYAMGTDYRSSLKFFDHPELRNYFTYLEPDVMNPGWFRVPRIYAPAQNGYNIIPIKPEPGVRHVSVALAGINDTAQRSEWRATLVAVNKEFSERFSSTWASGKGEIDLRPGESLYLVVAATPLTHSPPKFVVRYPDVPVFPYAIRCTGCVPNNLSERIRPYKMPEKYHRHANGGGLVADTATVSDTAYVGKDAVVLESAHVQNNARIEDYATIAGDALIADTAIVCGNALVTGRARVMESALVSGFAELHESAFVHGHARILDSGRVFGRNEINDEAVVKGFASIRSVNKMSGGAIADGEVEWDYGAPELNTDVTFGTLLQPDPGKHIQSKHLYAMYPGDEFSNAKLRDTFGSNDGYLHGGASNVSDPILKRALLLDGKSGFAELPTDVSGAEDITFSARVWIDGPAAMQPILSLRSTGAFNLTLLARNKNGNLELNWNSGGVRTAREYSSLPLHAWTSIAVTLSGGRTSVYVTGKRMSATNDSTTKPDRCKFETVLLGHEPGGGYLMGRLSDIRFYTAALSDEAVQEISERPAQSR